MNGINQTSQAQQPTNPTPNPVNNSSGSKLIPIILGIAAVVIIAIGAYALGTKQTQVPVQNVTQAVQPSPTPIDETANWKTYENTKGQYSFKYPSDWELKEETTVGNDIPVISISPKVTPCPTNVNPLTCEYSHVISILTINNPKNLSIEEYNRQFYSVNPGEKDFVQYMPITVGGIEGSRTSDIPGRFTEDKVFIKRGQRIYQITHLQSTGKEISSETFDQILATFQFTQ